MQLMDDEGYLSESAYAALLDGQDGELLPKESDLSDLRHPDLIQMSQDNNNALTEYAEFYDLDPAVARATLQGYDFTLA